MDIVNRQTRSQMMSRIRGKNTKTAGDLLCGGYDNNLYRNQLRLRDAEKEHEAARHPRFLILDTIEDKGMEPERSHHFQELLAEMSTNADVDHQLIYATAMIAPSLENTNHVVDRFYTHNDRTLKLLN
jgi:hypothetical protein